MRLLLESSLTSRVQVTEVVINFFSCVRVVRAGQRPIHHLVVHMLKPWLQLILKESSENYTKVFRCSGSFILKQPFFNRTTANIEAYNLVTDTIGLE